MPGYNAFTHYWRRHDIAFDGGGRPEPHPRYETPPGRQLQFDWKEDLRMTSRPGEAFEFNVFSATLGCSRMHRFVYSKGRPGTSSSRAGPPPYRSTAACPRSG